MFGFYRLFNRFLDGDLMPAKKKKPVRRRSSRRSSTACTGSRVKDHFNTRCQIAKAKKKRAAKGGKA